MTKAYCALYVVPTPLGNLGDLTHRSEEILRTVDWIAAEDTRHSAPLLRQIGTTARLLPAHQHNELEAASRIVACLEKGESVALISDAGTPGISDPGARIVEAVQGAGFRVTPLPGACAATTALSAAGFVDTPFLFVGFLPSKSGQRRTVLEGLRTHAASLVFYEAPHRILETLGDLNQVLGDRTLVIARELTKLFEEIKRLPLSAAEDWVREDPNRQRGEFVLVVSGAEASTPDEAENTRILKLCLGEGLPLKQAVKLVCGITGESRNTVYARALTLKD